MKQTLELLIGQSGDTVRASYEGALLEQEEAEYAAVVEGRMRRLSEERASGESLDPERGNVNGCAVDGV